MFSNQQQMMGPQREYMPQQRMQPGAARPPYLQVYIHLQYLIYDCVLV